MSVVGIKECIESYAQKNGITKTEAEKQFKSALEVISEKCVEGGVSFKGLFTIKAKNRPARQGKVNGVEWHSEPKTVLSFSIGKDLETRMNQ